MNLEDKVASMTLENGTVQSPSRHDKRHSYINWEDYFMATALLAAQRSKDPKCQVGACIVDRERKIVGIGYNGMPNGCSDDIFPWGKPAAKEDEDPLNNKLLYVCHAEVNAIVNKNSIDLRGCKIYVSRFPCNECAKVIIQSGITEVVYLSNKGKEETIYKAAKRMFDAVNLTYRAHNPQVKKIEIAFE